MTANSEKYLILHSLNLILAIFVNKLLTKNERRKTENRCSPRRVEQA